MPGWKLKRAAWAVVILLAACAPAGPSLTTSASQDVAVAKPATPKRAIAAIQGIPNTVFNRFNPGSSQGGIDAIEVMLNSGLVIHDDQGVLRPLLAEAVPTVENGQWKVLPDGRMELTWTIRPGAQWHDEVPFTSADLLFTARLGQEREVPIFGDGAYNLIQSVETPDPRTVVVRWQRPYILADFMFSRLLAMPVPQHLLATAYAENKVTFTEHPFFFQQFIGTGPFKLREVVEGSHLVVAANERYVLGRPKIDEIEIRFIPDAQTLVTHLLAGGSDFLLGPRISLDLALQARDQWKDGKVMIGYQPGMGLVIYTQFIDADPPIITDVRFRRALLHAIDRPQLLDTLVEGQTAIAHSPVNPTDPEYKATESSIVRYDYDPRRAAQLMGELGYTRAADGSLRDSANRPLSFEARAYAQLDVQPKAMLAVADYWQRLGATVEQAIVPNILVANEEYRHTRKAFEVLQVGGVQDYMHFHSSRVPLPANNFFGSNRSRYANPELDSHIAQHLMTIPRAERSEVLGRVVHHVTDQLVTMGLFYTTSHALVSNRVANVTARSAFSTDAWNAHEWELK